MQSNRRRGRPEPPSPFLIDAYHEETVNDETRTVLRLDPRRSLQGGHSSLVEEEELIEPAGADRTELRQRWMVEMDVTQSIGRRYRRQDEIGTPYAVTVDFETLEDRAVTVRSGLDETDRVSMDRLVDYLTGKRLG